MIIRYTDSWLFPYLLDTQEKVEWANNLAKQLEGRTFYERRVGDSFNYRPIGYGDVREG